MPWKTCLGADVLWQKYNLEATTWGPYAFVYARWLGMGALASANEEAYIWDMQVNATWAKVLELTCLAKGVQFPISGLCDLYFYSWLW